MNQNSSNLADIDIPADGAWRAVTPAGEAAIAAIAASARETLLCSDFDGTLSPIVDDPMCARLHPGAADALATLGARLGQLAIVTGREADVVRSLGDLDSRPGMGKLVVLGQYGLERWDAATGETRVPPVPQGVRAALDEVRALLAESQPGQDLSGVAVEDKGRAIGVHTRRATDPDGSFAWLVGPLTRIAAEHGLVVEPGRNVIELRSSTITKGDAIRALVDELNPAVVVMMGDDLGDLAAFDAVQSLPAGTTGICVVAGSVEQPAVAARADVLCGGPAGVAAWLTELAAALTDSTRWLSLSKPPFAG